MRKLRQSSRAARGCFVIPAPSRSEPLWLAAAFILKSAASLFGLLPLAYRLGRVRTLSSGQLLPLRKKSRLSPLFTYKCVHNAPTARPIFCGQGHLLCSTRWNKLPKAA